MKLYGWEKVNSSEEYREMIQAEYYRLKREREMYGRDNNLEEVKLRLFLSLLDKPDAKRAGAKQEQDPLHGQKQEPPYPSAA
jgi:hypothetical protein